MCVVLPAHPWIICWPIWSGCLRTQIGYIDHPTSIKWRTPPSITMLQSHLLCWICLTTASILYRADAFFWPVPHVRLLDVDRSCHNNHMATPTASSSVAAMLPAIEPYKPTFSIFSSFNSSHHPPAHLTLSITPPIPHINTPHLLA
jgi:hypothetical protein